MPYFETSAKEDYNVDDAFLCIARTALSNQHDEQEMLVNLYLSLLNLNFCFYFYLLFSDTFQKYFESRIQKQSQKKDVHANDFGCNHVTSS